jgi:hypothetical protein
MTLRRILRSAAFVAAALVVPATHVVFPTDVVADDKKKDDKTKKDAAQVKREQNLKAIATSFEKHEKQDVEALLKRVPEDQKVTLDLDGKHGDYSQKQAEGVLEAYFKGVEKLVVFKDENDKQKPAKFEQNVGSFPVTVTKKGADKPKDGTLGVTLGDLAGGDYTLRKLSVIEK